MLVALLLLEYLLFTPYFLAKKIVLFKITLFICHKKLYYLFFLLITIKILQKRISYPNLMLYQVDDCVNLIFQKFSFIF